MVFQQIQGQRDIEHDVGDRLVYLVGRERDQLDGDYRLEGDSGFNQVGAQFLQKLGNRARFRLPALFRPRPPPPSAAALPR